MQNAVFMASLSSPGATSCSENSKISALMKPLRGPDYPGCHAAPSRHHGWDLVWDLFSSLRGEFQNMPLWATELHGPVWRRLRSETVVALAPAPSYNYDLWVQWQTVWTVGFYWSVNQPTELHYRIGPTVQMSRIRFRRLLPWKHEN